MKALILDEIGRLEYRDVHTPTPGRGEVLVKVKACGICGSDIPRAYRDGAHNMPLIIGHEFSGCVEAVGEGVSGEWTRKRVGVFPLIPCRKCGPCRAGRYELCRNYDYLGSRRNGGFAEYVTVPEWNLIALPEGVSYEAAAMTEPMAVARHAMTRVRPAGTIVVCGLGTIGTFLVMLLLDAGFENILAIGNKEFQRHTMHELGVPEQDYCDSSAQSPYDFIMDRTGGEGAATVFECVGSNEVASLAVNSAAPSGAVCFVGNPHSDMKFEKDVYWKILRNQLTISGTWNSSYLGDENEDDWKYVLRRLATGNINPERLITRRYDLENIHKGFELMRDKTEDYIKVMAVL